MKMDPCLLIPLKFYPLIRYLLRLCRFDTASFFLSSYACLKVYFMWNSFIPSMRLLCFIVEVIPSVIGK